VRTKINRYKDLGTKKQKLWKFGEDVFKLCSRLPFSDWPLASCISEKKKEKLMPGNPGIFLIL